MYTRRGTQIANSSENTDVTVTGFVHARGKTRKSDQGYMVFEGKTTPSCRTRTIGLRFMLFDSGGKEPSTSVQRTSTYGEGSEPKKTVTGSVFEKFSP